jgi:hypothetical protein
MHQRERIATIYTLGSEPPVIVRTIGILLMTALLGAAKDPAADRYWAQWRGPDATGVARHANPPVEWSETKNIRWKVEIPGRGSSSPIVWGDRIFLLTAVPVGVGGTAAHEPRGGLPQRDKHRYLVLAIDRRTGQDPLGTSREREHSARAEPSGQRHVGIELGDHRRQTRCSHGSSRRACTSTTWTASCSGKKISATS